MPLIKVHMIQAKAIRLLDITISGCGLVILFPVLIILFFGALLDTGKPLFRQERLGKEMVPFTLYKFRSMKVGTSSLPSHHVPVNQITQFGSTIRRFKLDELPQLFNVIVGDMSLIGPRPSLCDQFDVITARLKYNIYSVRPGITGVAQISGIDMSQPDLLAKADLQTIGKLNICGYISLILSTLRKLSGALNNS